VIFFFFSLLFQDFSFLNTIPGSLPPLQESYQVYTNENTTAEQLKAFEDEYFDLALAMVAYIDLFLFETISSTAEALIAARAASRIHKLHPNIPWWISFTLEDSERAVLRSGEPLALAAQQVCEKFPSLEAILINCCAPAAVTAGLKVLKPIADDNKVKIGGYGNGFQTTTSQWLAQDSSAAAATEVPPKTSSPSSQSIDTLPATEKITQQGGIDNNVLISLPGGEYDDEGIILPEAYLKHARQWRSEGAIIIGGCCGIGPEHIAQLAAHLNQ
jgi:S-methylmethionine-dependent homocysteine/selenocysteine methylase